MHFNMLHTSTETEGLIKELVFSMVLDYMEIGNFQKQPFWHQTFVLLACRHVESQAVSMKKFVHFDIVHS